MAKDIVMITFRWEPLNYLLATGIAQLGARSWEESGNDKQTFDYDPDWDRYGRMEKSDILRFIAVREGEELIGYASVIIGSNLHDKKICVAYVQDIFIAPEKRRGGTAEKLMDYLESQLSSIKVQHVTMGARLQVGAVGRWLERRGYNCGEYIYTKSLGSIH